jgi:putative membrane protein
MSPILTDADLDRVRQAVGEAEQRTSGEIVPYVVERSGSYEVAVWRGASAGALLAMGLGVLLLQFYDGWGLGWLYTNWGMALLASLAGAAGAALTAAIAPLKRLLAGAERLTRRVHRRASLAFLEEEVFTTRDRTGILLFVSLFEHRIEVLGDAGISAQVSDDEWIEIVDTIRAGIKGGRFADGLAEAVGMCGHLLEKKGLAVRHDDTDELPDDVRLREE